MSTNSIEILQDSEKMRKETSSAIRNWDKRTKLGSHPFCQFEAVQTIRWEKGFKANTSENEAEALRVFLRSCIKELAPKGEIPPSKEGHPHLLGSHKLNNPEWRFYNIPALLTDGRLSDQIVQTRINLTGGEYGRIKKKALEDLAEEVIAKAENDAPYIDKYYIERNVDHQLIGEFQTVQGRMVVIRGARQMGKTLLLSRGVRQLQNQRTAKFIYFDLQGIGDVARSSHEMLLYLLAKCVVKGLGLNEAEFERIWHQEPTINPGVQNQLNSLFEDFILPSLHVPLILALDEVDLLLPTSFRNDFFGMLRSWHNRGSNQDSWEKLKLILVISTEPYLLIDDIYQSPFNVGRTLYLEDFSDVQLRELNQRYGSPLSKDDLPSFKALFNGHPYLSQTALRAMVTDNISWSILKTNATSDQGPFINHLKHQHKLLNNQPILRKVFKQIVNHKQALFFLQKIFTSNKKKEEQKHASFRLLKAGLIKKQGDNFTCRCELYRKYFMDKL